MDTEVNHIVMRDIKTQMQKIAKDKPINNSGSFALTLLWQIFEAAGDLFEEWEEINKLNDDDIEFAFMLMFPVFISEYPKVTTLDA